MQATDRNDPQDSHVSTGTSPTHADEIGSASHDTPAENAAVPVHHDTPATSTNGSPRASEPTHSVVVPSPSRYRKWLLLAAALAGLAMAVHFLIPLVNTALNTVSTEDAYVNGHATFVAPRVSGQVMKVFVDDNQRVKKGDLLVQLDKEPYEVQVALKRAAVQVAEANVAAAEAQARGLEAQLGA